MVTQRDRWNLRDRRETAFAVSVSELIQLSQVYAYTFFFLIAAESGIVKAWAIRRMVEGQREDGELLKSIKGSPINWKVDASEDPQLVEVEDKNDPALTPDLGIQAGRRTGEQRS